MPGRVCPSGAAPRAAGVYLGLFTQVYTLTLTAVRGHAGRMRVMHTLCSVPRIIVLIVLILILIILVVVVLLVVVDAVG